MGYFITAEREIIKVVDVAEYCKANFKFVRPMTEKEISALMQGHYERKLTFSVDWHIVIFLKKKYFEVNPKGRFE